MLEDMQWKEGDLTESGPTATCSARFLKDGDVIVASGRHGYIYANGERRRLWLKWHMGEAARPLDEIFGPDDEVSVRVKPPVASATAEPSSMSASEVEMEADSEETRVKRAVLAAEYLDKAAGMEARDIRKIESPDPINPSHYKQGGMEVIDIIEAFGLNFNFNLGNAIKYILRHKNKGGLEDLQKARWYLDREIANKEKLA